MKTQNPIDGKLQSFLLAAHPVGSYYWSSDATSPAELFGGTWERIENRFVFAAGAGHTVGSTGGEETHQLTVAELAAHKHILAQSIAENPSLTPIPHNSGYDIPSTGNKDTFGYVNSHTFTAGNSQPHNNMPPYITAYCWRRTA